MCTISLGSRIFCDGEYGTVLYVGKVGSFHGIWLGIEWDNPERGKHDGSYNGVNYFKTRSLKGGSFIRPEKAKIGRACPDGILERYCSSNENVLDENNLSIPQKYGKKRMIEFVGLEKITTKQSQLHQIETVDLSSMLINGPGQPGALSNLIPNVTNMILSQNLFTSWNMIADITIQLPHLTVLNISENKLLIPENPVELKTAFRTIKTLILNKMSYNWSQIMKCAVMWPDVEYLDLWSNRISDITEIPTDIFIYLQSLNISDNPIGNWEEINKFGKLPRLEKLIADNSKLSGVTLPAISSTTETLFSNLKCLYLTNNKLSEWKDIAELHKLKNLEELKVKGNPVMSLETLETSHQFVIARLPSLKYLNGLTITKEDRRGAELDYLKKYCEQWLKSGGHRDPKLNKPSCEFLNEHPTYLKLLEEYGAPEDSELKKQSELLKNNLISVELCCPINPDKKPVAKKLPATMTVGKVKTLACRLFNQNAQDSILWVVSSKANEPEIEMDNDLRELSFYSVRNGDKLYVR
ncbi:tubulin-specific chaperone E [Centruroides vittatus]|uniref:tubulin-specific chaperone E n=1 Tax=Centruroides vittatus TaxID=120091 RepID=UPI00350EA06C